MIRITRTAGIGKKRPKCTAQVKLAAEPTQTRNYREWQARREGRDPSLCGRPAYYYVEGNPRCQHHAGQDALACLMWEDEN